MSTNFQAINHSAECENQNDSLVLTAGNENESQGGEFSFYKAPLSNVLPKKNVTLQGVAKLIQGNTYLFNTERLRRADAKEEQGVFKQNKFDFATFAGLFVRRCNQGLVTRSGYICVDLDKVGDCMDIERIKQKILQNILPALMFISPSGNGLKVVYKLKIDDGEHNDYFDALVNYFQTIIGFEIDISGKDIARACLLPHDAGVYYDEEHCGILDRSFLDTFVVSNNDYANHISTTDRKSDPTSRLENWLKNKETFKTGNRHNFITKLAAACNRFGLPQQVVMQRLCMYSQAGFPQKEIKSIVLGIYKQTKWHGISSFDELRGSKDSKPNNDKSVASCEQHNCEVPLFPIEGFPFPIQELIKECARIYGTHQDYWAASILMATAIAAGCSYELKDKYHNGALLWMALVGHSGVGKSEPIDFAMKPIFEADAKAIEVYEAELKAYSHAMDALSMKSDGKKGPLPEKPSLRTYITVDSTPEALVEAHQQNPRGIAIIRDELLGMVLDFGRYKNGSGESQNMLSSWSEKFFKINRKGKAGCIKKPFIPIFGGIQPQRLNVLAENGRLNDGFLARFDFIFPDKCTRPDYTDDVIGRSYLEYYYGYINKLLNYDSYRAPVYLSPDAKASYKAFYQRNAAIIDDEVSDYLREAYAKLDIIVLRVALILHLSHQVAFETEDRPVSPEIMNYAVKVAEYFRATTRKVQQYLETPPGSDNEVNKRIVARFLWKIGKITKTALAAALDTSRAQLNRLLE